MESRISVVEVALATGTLSEDAKQKFEGIQKQVDALKNEQNTSTDTDENQMTRTALFVHFKNVSVEQAEQWVMI